MKFRDKKEFYSLRKYKGIGLASALVGLAFLSPSVMAEEVATPNTATGDVSVVSSTPENDKVSETSENTGVATTTSVPEVAKEESVANETVVSEESSKPAETDKPIDISTPVVVDLPKVESPKLEEAPINAQPAEGSLTTRSSEPVVTESSQPVRSRRGKRDVSGSSVPMRTYYSSTEYVTTDSSNIQEVTKIDYTTSQNPSLAEVDKGIYNNQIESIEQLPTNTPKAYRFRVKLKDGESIPDGGKLLLSSLGLKEPVSADLFIGTDKIGAIKTYSAEHNPDSITERLNKVKYVDSYIALFESMKPTDQPLTSLVFEFNKQFSAYNRNRVVEFELTWSKYNVVSHLVNSNESAKRVLIGTNGVEHTPEKSLKGYLLNPYDTKAITAGTIVNMVQIDNPPHTFGYLSNLRVDTGWVGVTKPYYFDNFYLSAPKQFEVINRDLSSSPIVGHANDTFKFEVPENSLFATSGYSVGDVVELTGRDFTTPKEETTPNRFINSDKFATIRSGEYKTRNIKVSFQLVEKTDRSYTWKLVNDLVVENAQLELDVKKLFPFQPRRDWMTRFGETKLKEFLSGTSRNGSPYLTNNQLQSTMTTNIGGVEKSSTGTGEIQKNVNILFGEATTGSVKVVHKTDAGVTLKEEVVATNKPWYTPINLDPATFEGYQFVSSSETLSTLVGQGDRTIELVYAKPSETVEKDYLPTKYIVDNTKDGTYRNIVEGSPTVTTVRKEYIYSPITRTSTPKYTTTKVEGKPMVVTVGSKPTTEVTYQDFTTRYVADPTRTAGEKFTETVGVRGTTTVETTYSVNKETGVVTPTKGQPVVVAPKEAVDKVGTKPTVVETEIPVTTTYKADNSLDFGKEVVESQGQAGTRTVTTPKVLNTQDGTVSDGQPTTKETPMTPKVVKKGTKPTVTEKPINFTTVYEADKTKESGVHTDKVVGVQGKVITTTTYTLNESTGNVTANTPSERREEPTNKVVLVGTKPKEVVQDIAITTKYIEDTTLEAGKEVEVEKGSAGRTVTTTTYMLNTVDGTVTANKPTVETTPMVQRVVKVGIKPKVVETPVNFTTRYERDDTAEAGKKTTTVTGVNGKVTTTTTYTLNPTTGKVTENTTSVKEEPTTEVVKVGTKPKVVVETWRVLPRYQEDPTKSAGSKVTLVEGSDGIKTTTTPYELNTSDGSVTEGATTVKIIQPNIKVISVGTKPKVSVTNIPYTVGYEANPEAEAGVSSTKVTGVDGKVTTTTTYMLSPKNGEVTPNKPTSVRTEPVNKVISVGAKSNTFVVEQDYEVSYVEDTSKEVGFKEVRSKGTKGSTTYTTTYSVDPKTGEVSSKELEPKVVSPKDEVVVLGTKPSVFVTTIPKTVRYVKDLEKEKGVTTVSVEGSDGSITTTTTYTVNSYTGDVSPNTPTSVKVPAVDKVVMVGAKTEVVRSKDDKGRDVIDTTTYSVNPKTGKVTPSTVRTYGTTKEPTVETRVVPAPVRYEKDSSKDKGIPPVTEKGIDGEETITTTYVVDKTTGKITVVVGKPVRTKEPKETIVKVPAKDKVVVTPIESTIVYVKDPTRTVGEPNVTIPGSNGSKTVTTTYTVNPKTGEITETGGSPAVKPAKDTIIKVASKDKVEYYRNMGSVIRRTTSYTVNPKTGAVTPVTPVKEELVSSVPNDAPVVDLPEYTEPIGTTPNDAPVLDIPEFTGGVNPYDAPQVEKPEFKGGVTPNDAPVHELPEFKGGVVPNDAPVLELPELKVPEEPAKPQPTNVGGKVKETTQTSTQEPVQEAQLPNTGGGDSAKASAFGIVSLLAGLGIASRKRKEN